VALWDMFVALLVCYIISGATDLTQDADILKIYSKSAQNIFQQKSAPIF
jgi:hypothetical protein